MADALGWRRKFAVLVPSTNTVVQPEFDGMRPAGVTNHISRIRIPNLPLASDADFRRLVELIAAAQLEAVDSALTCEPDHVVLGISVETFWGGLAASGKLMEELAAHTKLGVTGGAGACAAAFAALGVKRIAVLTPYFPVGDANVRQFFEESGYAVARIKGLRCASPVQIAHVPPAALRAAVDELDGDDVDAVIQVGTNLAMARLAGEQEAVRGKPVLAINACIYWHALRANGIADRSAGWGSLLEKH
jgi:maleate isomerase